MKKIGTPLEEPEVAKAVTPSDATTAASEEVVAPPKATPNAESSVIISPRAALTRRIVEQAVPRFDLALWMVFDAVLIIVLFLADYVVETVRKHVPVDSATKSVANILGTVFHVAIILAVIVLLCFDLFAFAKSSYERIKRRR